ncbi:hypothetical protein ABK040_005970 [Willaertia magna]
MKKYLVLLLLVFVGILNLSNQQDMGEDVVNVVLGKLSSIGWLDSNSYIFMKRIALCESNYGRNPNTYRRGYYGGIWQIDSIGFKDTQDTSSHPSLKSRFAQLKDGLGIDWINTNWQYCTKAVYSGIAARLKLLLNPRAIPTTLEGQAQYWKSYYNTDSGAGTVQYFIDCCKSGGLG